ncbi:hypothetical protein [Nitrospina gracilis]|uniref:hypothetical protein n=1 Tax=Nitrospina gracilis TaxID=35801 RepID=UPI001F44AC75|nr:hypothetical protein [Nitrospina gracilis]MCF8719229.1 hypothetical protein [Nitrospina gracilis Nb-211]
MLQFREKLKGKKAYIVSVLMVLVALVNLITGDMGLVEFVASPHLQLLLEGLGLGAARAAVASLSDSKKEAL